MNAPIQQAKRAAATRSLPGKRHIRQGKLRAISSEDFQAFDALLDRKLARLDALESKVDSQGSKLDSLESKVDSQGSKLDSLESKVDSQGSKLDSQGSKLDSLESKVDSQGSTFKGQLERLETSFNREWEVIHRREVAEAKGPRWAKSYTIDNATQLLNLATSSDESNDPSSMIHKYESLGLLVQEAVPRLMEVTANAIARILHIEQPIDSDVSVLHAFISGQLSIINDENKALFSILKRLLEAATRLESTKNNLQRLMSCDLYVVGLLDFSAAGNLYIEAINSSASFADLATALPPDVLQIDCRGTIEVSHDFVYIEVGEMKMGKSNIVAGIDQLVRALRILKLTRDAWAQLTDYRLTGRLIIRDVKDVSALRANIMERLAKLGVSDEIDIKLMIL